MSSASWNGLFNSIQISSLDNHYSKENLINMAYKSVNYSLMYFIFQIIGACIS